MRQSAGRKRETEMDELVLYLKPLFLTIFLEGIAACIIGYRSIREQLYILFINAVTNPLLVYFSFLLMYHIGVEKSTLIIYLLLEPLVILTEYLYYRKIFSGRNCFLLSLVLNMISIAGGILCQRILWR